MKVLRLMLPAFIGQDSEALLCEAYVAVDWCTVRKIMSPGLLTAKKKADCYKLSGF